MSLYRILLLLFLAGQLSAQKVLLYNNKHYAKWPLLDNRYHFYVPNIPCSEVVFKSDHGKIKQAGCQFFYTPDTVIDASFKVYRKVNRQLILIDSINITVYEDLGVQAWLGIKSGGTISKEEVLAIGGVNVKFNVSEDHSESMSISSYRVITIKGDKSESEQNIGGKYNEKVISLIKNLTTNDKLIFIDIKARDWLDRIKYSRPLEFTIL